IFGLLATPPGVLLAGSNGVYQVDIDFEAPAVLAVEPVFEDTFSYDLVASRHRPVVYVGTESGLGLLARVDGRWVSRGLVPGVTQRADTIAEDGDGRVWVGTGTGVVQALEWGAAQVPEVTLTLDAADGVPAGNAWVFSFGDDVIFATTEGGYRLSADTPPRLEPDPDFGNEQFVEEKDVFRFFSPDGEQAVAIVGASRGAVWYGERGEDGRLSWDHRAFAHLGPGLVPLLETTADGTLWVAIHPDTHAVPLAALAQADYPTSRLLLRRAGRADGESPLFAGIGPETVAEALPFASSALRFEYALASFVEPEQSEYRVRLVGLDDAWSPWSPETMRDYTNLAGGAYRFDVEARDARGVVAPVASLSFSIEPPGYLSPLAKVGYAALAILLLLAAAQIGQRIRNRRLLAEQRRLEGEVARRTAEVRAQAREIEALGEARARFFANVSHEFRTPLTLTRGPLRELAAGRAGALDDTARDHVALALRNTEAMESLIGQVLDINRLEVGRMPLRLARGDLAELVRRVAGRFELEARRRAIVLELTGTEDPLLVDFDPDHVDTILANLLSNALKFTPADGRVALTLAHDDQTATLTVADTGPGIDGEDPERVFERYVQGSATDPTHPGTGIGLALVKELTELHRGTVRLETRPGAGASFAVTLPLEGVGEASSAAPPVATRDPEAATGAGDAAAVPYVPPVDPDDVPTLLIVDDNDELRAFLRLRLQSSYRIVEAADGEAGLAVARAELPDAIVSDVMMPKRDGLGLTAALKADPETDFIPILLLTAKDLKRDVVAGLEQGADDYLGKPFDTAELAARVAGLIASRRRLRERLSELETPAPAGVRDRFLERAQDALREHLSDPGFGINDWAQLLHMDRTTLYRKLKAEAGTTPEKLLRETRLELAARLLRKGVGNVGEVADSVGFASISHFSRTFKARFGQTPAAWRQAAG
ncbi:MAG: hybrid sensor histidine kinase/response regulator transcription factor, partial [Pseudomonadota bacterium]